MASAPSIQTEHRAIITVCVMMATLMQSLDTTIANVALPFMQGSLSASQDQINWVLTSYIVASAIMTPPTGWIAARFGRTRLFVVAVAGFTVASVMCGLAESLSGIVLFRLLQGVFGASLVPLSQAVLLDIYPKEQQGSAMGIWGVGVMVGPILGPTLGSWLTDNFGWRWVFFINVPIGVITWIGLTTFLGETKKITESKFDWFGFASLSVALGAMQIGLDRGEQLDWLGSNEIIAEFAVAALAFYVFVVHMATAKKPFISLALFKDRNFVVGLSLIFMVGVVLLANLALMTPFLEQLAGYPIQTAGLVMSPRGAGTMVTMMLGGWLIGKGLARPVIAVGLCLIAYSLYVMTGFTTDVPQWTIAINGIEQGAGIGFVFVPVTSIAFTTLSPALRTEAAGLFSLARNIGSAIGISIVMSLLEKNVQVNHAALSTLVTPFNGLFQSGAAASVFGPTDPRTAAALDATITGQATLIAYLDNFKLMMFLTLATIPLLLIIKPPKKGQPVEPAVLD